MWLLENAGSAFQGRQLWLRPGTRYLFGRTRAEPGQLVISDKTISRKHLTISVDRVRDGDGRDADARSVVTIEDLATKIGTVVNGTQIRGQKFVLVADANDLKMGHMPDLFRITWQPVVLSFSFTSKELRALPDPWRQLARDLEPLDIKFLPEFDRARTTHVVAKKRNTSKGLQALVNGSYIVTEAFIGAIVAAAATGSLETDFAAAWPDALAYLPPRGDEPSDRAVSTYGPDARRASIFEGYTFVFYDQKQFDTLLPPIADGRGKALLGTVVPGHTDVDDFVRYVKGVAGEKGLGEFEDGSAGRGVVVVRHVPAKGDHVQWFTRFTTAVALRLDHRLVDQREFLDAVLAVEPGMLRRPLEVDTAGADVDVDTGADADVGADAVGVDAAAMDVDDRDEPRRPPPPSQSLSQASSTRRARARRGGIASRFKGFDVDLDSGDEEQQQHDGKDMFMSQTPAADEAPPPAQTQTHTQTQTRRNKRQPDEDADGKNDVMDDIAPTAALVKRRRLEAGIDAVPARQSEEDGESDDEQEKTAGKKEEEKTSGKKERVSVKKEDAGDILGQARRNREAADEKHREAAERERLAGAHMLDDGIDAAAVRKLTLVETIAVRPAAAPRSREQDIADGRWDPRWNGRRNYKKFRRQGDVVGRAPQRVIVGLEPAKTKEYGIGEDYWLEGGEDDEEGAWRGSGARRPAGPVNTASVTNRRSGTPSARVVDDLDDASIGPDDLASDAGDAGDAPVSVPSNTTGSVRRPVPATVPAAMPLSASPRSSRGGESLGSGMVNLEIIPDTDPEDEHHVGTLSSRDDGDDSLSTTAPSLASDLPRTRAGKAASRAPRPSQTAAKPSRAASRRGALPLSGDTNTTSASASGSSIFESAHSVQAPSTQLSDARAMRGAKRAAAAAPAAAARLQSPAKRPRRGMADTDSPAASAPIAISDSDDDDGLRFKFRR